MNSLTIYFGWVCIACFLVSPLTAFQSSLAICMMVRDEAVNLRVNLPLWTLVADAFVILVDERTVDDSKSVATSILSKSKKSYVLADYKFSGFGQARTLSLSKTWEHFPNATHVLIADPDWKPDVSTIDLNDLDNSADVFRFTVFDRNGIYLFSYIFIKLIFLRPLLQE